jgi:outer membrane protein
MKKLAIGLITAISLANADFMGVSVGAGIWQQNISGYAKVGDTINYFNNKAAETDGDNNTGNLGLEDTSNPYVWAQIIHPMPLIPNVKGQFTRYDTSGDGIASGSIKIFGKEINLNNRVHTEMLINSYDLTFFYELKIFAEVEAGFGVNVLDGTTKVTPQGQDTTTTNWTVPVPYLYARGETPTILGFSVEAQAKYLDIGDAFYHDYQGAIKYHLPSPIIDVTISAGYRSQEIYGEDGDNTTDLKYEGGYLEVGARW